MTIKEDLHCGFVSILGIPNAGKSTLVNSLVGYKVSIVTPKVQTTRARVLGILISDHSQIILVDTPGIFSPKRRLEKAMVKAAWRSVSDADIIAVIVDAHHRDLSKSEELIDHLNQSGHIPILILNKIDLLDKGQLLAIADQLTKGRDIKKTFMISATRGNGIDDIRKYLAASVPHGPWHYPADQITDLPQRVMAAEITREKIFLFLHQELPYSITVETDAWEESDDGSVKIHQTIFVQKDSQKMIVIGKGGHQIKTIGEKSRQELSFLLDRKVHLFLHVKVKEHWTEKASHYHAMGLEFE